MARKREPEVFALDTSAVLAFLEGEPSATEVRRVLRQGERGEARVLLPFMMLMEAYYRVWQLRGREEAEEILTLLEALPAERVAVEDEILRLAGEIKALYRLSVADAWILATAQRYNAQLLHKDPEFEQVSERVKLISLPYKRSESAS
jgi:predicted nucleic acid-binding protein